MVRRFLRTRSRKKVRVNTPGGLNVVHFKEGKPGKHVCGRCCNSLGGMPNLVQSEIGSLKSSERIPSRPYAGVLCNQCLSDLVRYVSRLEVKYSNPVFKKLELQRDLTLEKFLPRGWHEQVSGGKVRLEQVLKKAGVKKEKPVEKPVVAESKPAVKKTAAKKAKAK
jgi:large subunit ribosomal protein L34e